MAGFAPFPHRYSVTLADGRLVAPPRAPIAAGPPPQFGGTDEVWSPEELLVSAVLTCLWTTFNAYARKEGLEVRQWRGSGTGVLEKSATGPTFTSIALTVDLLLPDGDEERGRRIIATAEKHCIISNALRCPVTLSATVRTA